MSTDRSGFWEEGFRVTWAPDAAELAGVHALRAEVFCRELRWVGTPSDDRERDEFDAGCTTIAVLRPGAEVLGTIRLVPSDRPWMFDQVFRDLVPDHGALRRERSVEASRLAVSRGARRVRLSGGRTIADLVFKAAFRVCLQRGVRYVYMLTSDKVGRRLTGTGLPAAPLGAPTEMPDGVVAVPLGVDWEDLAATSSLRAWFEDRDARRDLPPPRLDAERTRRCQASPASSVADLAPSWREQRVRASG
jgi:N-acyl-L-homoserine lactone synthetase